MHQKLENLMGRFGAFIHDNPFKVLLVLVLLLALPIAHVPQIKMDTSTEGFMHDDDPVLLTYNDFREQFGRDERIIIAIEDENIFSLDFLTKLKSMHKEIESTIPYLDDVTSLYNVRNTRGEGDKLITDDLLENFPKTEQELAQIKEQAMASHFYKDLLLSQDGKVTTMVIETDAYSHVGEQEVSVEDEFSEGFGDEATQNTVVDRGFLSDQENKELISALYGVLEKYEAQGLKMHVAGSPVVNNALKAQMRADMQKFMRITFLIILVFLFLVFRRLSAVVYPLLVIVFSLMTTIGLMAWSGVAFKLPTQIVPSLLLAVSVGATVHILSVFFDRFNANGDKKEALSYTMGHSGLAIAMTSVTTAIGIGAFAGSEVAPIADLGLFAAIGVLVSLLLTLTLLPALLSITKLKAKEKVEAGKIDNLMKNLAVIPVKHTKKVLFGSLAVVLLSFLAASTIKPSHDPLTWFQEGHKNRVATDAIDTHMNGTVTIEVVIDTEEENGWKNPERLAKLDKLSETLITYKDDYTHVGKVVSLATIVKETNRALNENQESFYTIPKDQNLLSQELLLFENSGSDDLEDVVDSQFSKARMTIKLPWAGAVEAYDALEYVKQTCEETFKDEKVSTTGMMPLLINTFSNAVYSSVESYFIAGIAITFMMMLILGSMRLGLISMIPNLAPIIVGLLVMYLIDAPLDMFTLLIGSIAIGLAVDDTIHFMHNFKRYYLQSGDTLQAMEQTFFTTGKAMLITTIVLSLGFFSYMAANMISVQNFGILTGSVITFALLSDLLLAPALMVLMAKRGWIK
ncbi:MAG: Predicted exporter of the RND superfamily [uncultured Sulfurovum sp.]|uniref:Predicted exporter of the RND superfamily n=1 Tax=uncultured Sulfurovum sp. TaxID=269237 RepID=A0A6S6T6I2_9BACT|nr:MAG: Predicted exporter of the RND superfamily [uncultured Sulfurovum sp.]